ncbi:nitrous oxide-stimulated promoter family protein [Geopsychrobacter electrodiphilus]|uniref:nitrous oxide-stimulated promoter family protein n=1 Tax=Geopsychrobacter electrodiphilus TaxID=225196 RepID=UPI0003A7DF7F|nr:nitrous oxide-stimulated promoter family protein [Geopsychrobacter electrodiphilus]
MDKETKDLKVLALFTRVYCADHHAARERDVVVPGIASTAKGHYCTECADFLSYAIDRRRCCPLDPKPSCRHCTIHCYRPGHRDKVREIMRYSGKVLIMRGRFDLLWHYFF